MSQENVELAEELDAAYLRGGVEACLSLFDPDVEWRVPEWLEGETFLGHDGLRRANSVWAEQFDDFRLEADRFIDCPGEHVVALVYQRGRIKGTSTEVEQRVAYDYEFHEQKARRVLVYFSGDHPALKAVGLQE